MDEEEVEKAAPEVLTQEIWDDLKVTHPAIVMLTAAGQKFVMRMPTFDDLDSIVGANDPPAALKKLVNACCVWPSRERRFEILRAKGGLFMPLGGALMMAAGRKGPLTVLDEDELEDEMAKAYVAEQKKDFPGKLHPLVFERRQLRYEMILRDLRPLEVDEAMKFTRTEQHQALTRRVTVWGSADAYASTVPSLYHAITDYLSEQAGLQEQVEQGEFSG